MKLKLKNQSLIFITLSLLFFSSLLIAQSNPNIDLDTVKAQKFDTGRMWTFDYPPVEYLEATYGFSPSDDWLEDVRLSALRIPGCTSSFVSEDGLILTNHHCAEGLKRRIQKEGEDLASTGFYAATREEERKVENYYADQLVLIEDVTDEVISAFNSGETEEEKLKLKEEKIEELEKQYSEESGLRCRVVSLYNGGKYSLYGYRRYTDIRLVFIPETQIGYFGGDPDNFTYPRYNLDCSFLRIYDEDGNPIKSDNYFQFSKDGAKKDEVIFTVGNPGRTNRLKTVAQLKYYRDISYRNIAFNLDQVYNSYTDLMNKYPERRDEFFRLRDRIGNSQKSITNTYKGLLNPYLIARKQDFENNLKEAVFANDELNEKYGHVWDAIENTRKEMKEYGPKISAYAQNRFFGSVYFAIADNLIELAEQLKLPDEERSEDYKGIELDSLIERVYPENFNSIVENAKLAIQIDYITLNLGTENKLVEKIFGSKSGEEAAEFVLSSSSLTDKESVMNLAQKNPDEILDSEDPFIYYLMNTRDELKELQELASEVNETEDVHENLLGQAMYEVYGTSIPPDANFTLRLSDGVLQSFDYNGTIAPVKTTFYGLYDRYYSFDKEYPFELPERWENPPSDFDLSTPFNMISTNDIVGGNSGSPIINQNAEVVGLAFDGNIRSLIGNFIFLPKENRCVAVTSQAILEALEHLYDAKGLADELMKGKIE